ncbi:M14 family zinc carboxypeptidase [Neptunomonas japonica]|uniref:M14 family zinc carboxypeptidase n=1 Tax=Neptunomonas japonica TaxID=417574 RepID=UPI001FE18B2A|nr:M14 family zinc carboxypeptidase [Neptunomonas japonica]
MIKNRLLFLASFLCVLPALSFATTSVQPSSHKDIKTDVQLLCGKIGRKLSSVSVRECNKLAFDEPRFYSVGGLAILEKHFPAIRSDAPKVLFIGGIHGDEYSSVSVTFKWLNTLNKHHSGAYDWHFLPLANPDGLLRSRSSRVNFNKVDLNRNFIPASGFPEPLAHWKKKARERSRYYPGKAPLSEPESQVIHQLIEEYRPDVIVSVHAPHGILDFDGSGLKPPKKLGPLYLRQLGTYPGSLGNYAWFVKKIPVMTIELPHAGIMPSRNDIGRMWTDLVGWVDKSAVRKEVVLSE